MSAIGVGAVPKRGTSRGRRAAGMLVRVDPVRHIANEGSVSVVDLESGKVANEILTGLHASALAFLQTADSSWWRTPPRTI